MTDVSSRSIEASSFVLVANGAVDAPPAAGVWGHLASRAREVMAIFHPLNPDDPPEHRVLRWRWGELVEDRTVRRPSHPPFTYCLDLAFPIRRPRADAWIAFNNLAALHGIARRHFGRVSRVAYWAVDFVPDRFGAGTPLTRAYDAVDRVASKGVDLRVELTAAARDGRNERLGVAGATPVTLAPIGLWLNRLPRTPEDAWRKRRVIYSGHLVPRQGVATLLEAVALLPDVSLDIVGRGPIEEQLRTRAAELGISDRVRFLGFFSDHRDVERTLAEASVAAAPYADEAATFSRYADPSKIRLYVGVGLPVVTTPVPPSIDELEREAGVAVVEDDPRAIAGAIARVLAAPEEWAKRRAAALRYARAFDWGEIVDRVLHDLGFD